MNQLVKHLASLLLLLCGVALGAQQQTSITINGTEQNSGGVWDTGVITLTIKTPNSIDYVKTIEYGQYSTSSGIAAAFGGLLSNDANSPVNGRAFGTELRLLARSSKGGTLTSVTLTASGSSNSFSNTSWTSPPPPPPNPVINQLSLSEGPPQMGFVITGQGFGGTQGASSVTVGGVTANVVAAGWSDGSITVQVPAGLPNATQAVVVHVGSGAAAVASNSKNFTVEPPFACPVQ